MPVQVGHSSLPPNPNGNLLVDHAELIPNETESDIRAQLEAYRDSTGNEVAVLLIKSLDGVSVEDAAYQTFNSWGVGNAKEDNGVLLLIVSNDHLLRIEVGEGVEGELTDLQAKQIIDNNIVPPLKEQNFGKAVQQGVDGITGLLEGRPDAIKQSEAKKIDVPWWVWVLLLIIFLFLFKITNNGILFFLGSGSGGSSGRSSRSGGGFGGGSSGGGGASGSW